MQLCQLISLSILISVLYSCSQQPAEQAAAKVHVFQNDSVYYEIKSFYKEYGDCKPDTSAHCTKIDFNYPVFMSKSNGEKIGHINKTVERTLLQTLYPAQSIDDKSISEFADQFIRDYKEIRSSFGEALGWYAKVNGDVLRNDSTAITIKLSSDLYTGGAHGNFFIQYLNFDPDFGNLIVLDSIFELGYQEELNKIVENKFKENHAVAPDADLSDEGFQFENDQYYNPDNFALLPGRIVFYFNNYEIAPYSSGSFQVSVPWEELNHLLR